MAVAFASLIYFMWLLEPQYRWTFYRRQLERDWERDHWLDQEDSEVGDNRRAWRLHRNTSECAFFYPDLVRKWISSRKAMWDANQPEWYTEEWWVTIPSELRGEHVFGDAGGSGTSR